MRRRTTVIRSLALLWAALQLASPGASAIADGALARENASAPAMHVEATTTAACPVVHSPDCGVCRYLSTSANPQPPQAFSLSSVAERRDARTDIPQAGCASVALPHGRAPPV